MNPFLQAAKLADRLPDCPAWATRWRDRWGEHYSAGPGGAEFYRWIDRFDLEPEWVSIRPIFSSRWRTFHARPQALII